MGEQDLVAGGEEEAENSGLEFGKMQPGGEGGGWVVAKDSGEGGRGGNNPACLRLSVGTMDWRVKVSTILPETRRTCSTAPPHERMPPHSTASCSDGGGGGLVKG